MQKILSLFSYTPENVGDMGCTWGNVYRRYYPTTFAHVNDVRDDYDQFDLVVIGGGSIINKSHEEGVCRAIEKSKKCIIRSVGVKDWEFAKKLKDKLGENFTIRHQVDGYVYEPCPSLLEVKRYKMVHGINEFIPKNKELLFALHQNDKHEIKLLTEKNKDVLINNCTFEQALSTICQYKKIVTSSYHFMIWADAFGCEIELFKLKNETNLNSLDSDSDLRKFLMISIKYSCIDIDNYLM